MIARPGTAWPVPLPRHPRFFATAIIAALSVPIVGSAPAAEVASSRASAIEQPTSQRFMPAEILVKFGPTVSEAEIADLNATYGTSILNHIQEIDVYVLAIPPEATVEEMIDLYDRDPRVQYAEPNYVGRGGDFVPDDSAFGQQWHLNNTGQTGGSTDADIDAVEGWQLTRGSSAITVAVLDTGIDSDHPEFQGRLLPGFDFVNEDDDPEADHPHGVSVSGILAANSNNGFAVAGVDHNVTILPVKVLDQNNAGTIEDLIQGLIFAANQGADVINMSLINYAVTAALTDALQFARDAGSILIACAGNGGIGDADVSGPGVSPLTVAVGATDHDDARASFSGTGLALDVVAPGVDLPTAVWDSSADDFTLFGGCSAATPVVSGIVTLLLSLDPSLTHDEVRDILVATAEDEVGPPAEDAPGRDNFFGFGRVNLRRALLELAMEVAVDIRPRACPNLLLRRGIPLPVLPVAILGSFDLDVLEIDAASVRLAGVEPRLLPLVKDVATPFEPFLGKEQATDCTRAGPDGLRDLVLWFSPRQVIEALEPVSHSDVVVVPLTAMLRDGTPLHGEDVVVVIDILGKLQAKLH